MSRTEQLAQMKELFVKANLPHVELTVFGSLAINVHVVCESVSAANKWNSLLRKVLGPKARINTVETFIYNEVNTNLLANPSGRKGYLVGAIA